MGLNANEAAAEAAAPASSSSSSSHVKYRLVEAEEVATSPKAASVASVGKPKKKGKLNWSQYPVEGDEAERHSDESSTSVGAGAAAASAQVESQAVHHHEAHQSGNRGGFRGRGGRFGGRGGRFGGRRPTHDEHGTYINGVFVPNPDVKVTAQWAKSQMYVVNLWTATEVDWLVANGVCLLSLLLRTDSEFYLSPDNLVRDMFLRQHMDVDGYVPLAFVGSFQAVFAMHQDYPSLLEAVKDSDVLELDVENEKVRLRDGWQQWLWPNAEGGYGVPRYVKVAADEPADADIDAASA